MDFDGFRTDDFFFTTVRAALGASFLAAFFGATFGVALDFARTGVFAFLGAALDFARTVALVFFALR